MWVEIFLISLRVGLLLLSSLTSCVLTMGKLLGRQRSYMILGIYTAFNSILMKISIPCVLIRFYENEPWWQTFYLILNVTFAVLTYIVYCVTFQGSFLKIAIAGMIAEINYMAIFAVCLPVINRMRDGEIYDYYVPFYTADLLVLPMTGGILYIEYLCIERFLPMIQKYEPSQKIRGVLWAAFFAYIAVAVKSGVSVVMSGNSSIFSALLLATGFTGVTITALIFMYYKYYRQTACSRAFLLGQQEMIRLHYEAVRKQIEKMDRDQAEIDAQMEQIRILNQNSDQLSGKQIHRYLETLTEKYDDIRAGVYCNDWMVDAILYYMAEICRKNGIDCEISFANYKRGNILEEDLAELLFLLLDHGIKELTEREEKKVLSLKAAAVKNQLILEFSSTCLRKKRKVETAVTAYVTRYNGDLYRQKQNMEYSYSLVMKMQNG